MSSRRLLAGCAMALVLAACGSAGGDHGGSTPSGTPPVATTPSAGFDVLITDQDRAVSVSTGQRIEVYLRARSGMTSWGGVTTDNTAVLAPIPTGILAPRGVTVAGFKAVSAGTANITAYAGPLCSPGQACPMYAILFSVRVTVT